MNYYIEITSHRKDMSLLSGSFFYHGIRQQPKSLTEICVIFIVHNFRIIKKQLQVGLVLNEDVKNLVFQYIHKRGTLSDEDIDFFLPSYQTQLNLSVWTRRFMHHFPQISVHSVYDRLLTLCFIRNVPN